MELINVRHDIPISNLYSKISRQIGDRLINDARNGRYNGQHVIWLNSPVTNNIIKIYDNGKISIDILYILGYTTSGDPENIRVE